jgi:hypothetical protein
MLQAACSVLDWQALPPCRTGTTTERLCRRIPTPQVAVQELHALHLDCTQSTGQASVLHRRDSEVGQAVPPWPAATLTCGVRDCSPVPQVFEHAVQSLQVCSQCTGHSCSLHESMSSSDAQALPPCAGWVVTGRDRFKTPPPHSTEHSPNAPQSPTTQSTGQLAGLHDRVSETVPHPLPPYLATTRVSLVRI